MYRTNKHFKGLKDAATLKAKKAYVGEMLRQVGHTEAQIGAFIRPNYQRVRNWSEDDLQMALTLHVISPKAFKYIRTLRILPLPCQTTIKNYFPNFKTPHGYLHDVHKLLKIKAAQLEPHQRVVVLVFDEVYLKKEFSYDASEDQIYGPHGPSSSTLSMTNTTSHSGEF